MGKCISREEIGNNLDTIEKGIENIRDAIFSQDEQLMKIDVTKVPGVICQNDPIRALVVDVYDGDTITVVFLLGDTPIKIKIRIKGIDTPEIRSGKGKLKIEKQAAKKCRDYLNSLVGDKIVTLIITDWDKFGGRVIGTILFDDETCVTDHMIQSGYARPYSGDRKKDWTKQELVLIIDKV